jgi:hypothetical protein
MEFILLFSAADGIRYRPGLLLCFRGDRLLALPIMVKNCQTAQSIGWLQRLRRDKVMRICHLDREIVLGCAAKIR